MSVEKFQLQEIELPDGITLVFSDFSTYDHSTQYSLELSSKYLSEDLQLTNLDQVFQVIVKSAIFEFLYKPKVSTKIIIKEYLDASNFFLEDGQTKYLNAILDKIAKKIRITNA